MIKKIETIGNVKLDMEFYPGEDLYCDGEVENELLEAVKNGHDINNNDYKAVIDEKNNWPFLYHLSQFRGNIVSWFPMNKATKVLEIGSGCGAITSVIAPKCGELTCVDLSKKRSLINAYRNKDRDNITIKLGNFQDVEPSLDTDYDLILLIGVFEYAAAYIGSDSPYTKFLNIIKKHVKKDGHIIIAIENRMGLKYLAGCQEDHLGNYFSGIENYPDGGVVRTFTRPALEKIFKECEVSRYSFYYPYPDYKFMHTLYSDDRLPVKGELTTNLRNFDRDRMLLFDEKNAFDSIIEDGEFPLFSNSYLVILGDKPKTVYSKYSNDRAARYAIRTDLAMAKDGLVAIKYAENIAAEKHIDNIMKSYELLSERYANSSLSICPCETIDGGIRFKFIKGKTLEEVLDAVLDNEDEFTKIIGEYYNRISFNEGFEVTDKDLIFSNIIIDEDNNWNVIDYEWTYQEIIPSEQILARALYCYVLGAEKRKKLDVSSMAEQVTGKVDIYDFEKLNQNEIKYQKSITGGDKSMSEIRDSIHMEVLPVVDAIARYEISQQEKKVQIYFDEGNGFSEEKSIFVMPECNKTSGETGDNAESSNNLIWIKLNKNVKTLRFDPKMKACMIADTVAYVKRANGDIVYFPTKKVTHNGVDAGNGVVAFSHNDPNFTFALKHIKKFVSEDGDQFIIEYKDIL